MSTQFRSRIKTVIDYAINDSATGGCCLPDGTKLGNSTINECNQQSGFFRKGDPTTLQCPDRGLTGCCCSCSYIREQEGDFDTFLATVLEPANDSTLYHAQPVGDNLNVRGYKDNVSQCECFKRQGNWFYGQCNEVQNITSLCGSVEQETDIRIPAACCHGGGSNDTDILCTNVCTAKECSDLTTSSEDIGVYYGTAAGGNGGLCNYNYITDPVQCGDNLSQYNRVSYNSGETELKYPCFELITNNNQLEFKCSRKTSKECHNSKGYQYPSLNATDTCLSTSSLMYPPKRGSGSLRVTPPIINSSVTPPAIGDHYQGGIFMGTFIPGETIIQRRSGTLMEEILARGDNSGTNKKKWFLIYSYRPFDNFAYESHLSNTKFPMNTTAESALAQPTSFYDGFFNTYGDGAGFGGYYSELFENVRSLVFNGFNDWYIPSIDELSLIYKSYPTYRKNKDSSSYRSLSPFFISYYSQYKNMMSSTLYSVNDKLGKSDEISEQIVRGRGYVYAQNMKEETAIGTRQGLIYKADRRTKLTIPLVRRIYID
jgi:hypothetical protein